MHRIKFTYNSKRMQHRFCLCGICVSSFLWRGAVKIWLRTFLLSLFCIAKCTRNANELLLLLIQKKKNIGSFSSFFCRIYSIHKRIHVKEWKGPIGCCCTMNSDRMEYIFLLFFLLDYYLLKSERKQLCTNGIEGTRMSFTRMVVMLRMYTVNFPPKTNIGNNEDLYL